MTLLVCSPVMGVHKYIRKEDCIMAKFGLMTDTEIVAANNFNMAEDANVDAMAWSWSIAAKIALGVAGAFL